MASNADPGLMTLSLPQTEMVVAGIIILSCGWCKKKLGPDSTKWTLNLCSDLLLSNKPSHNLQRQKNKNKDNHGYRITRHRGYPDRYRRG